MTKNAKNEYEVVVDCENHEDLDVIIAVKNSIPTEEELDAVLPGVSTGPFYRYITRSTSMEDAIEKALTAISSFLTVPSKEDYERDLDNE